MATSIRVAIIGGGIMGCTLANGLLRYPAIDWHIFEGKSAFVERGAAVGFRANATKALAAMGLDPEKMYERAGAATSDASRDLVAFGEHKGKCIIELPPGHINVIRTRWLDELLGPLPKDRLHAGKKLASVNQDTGSSYVLSFEDGTTFETDVVIGCDGIHSLVRKLVLHEHPDLIAPRFGGYWDARGMTTPEEAAKRFGQELFDPLTSTQVALTGGGAFMMFCPSEDGSRYDVIVSAVAGAEFDRTAWKSDLNREFLDNAFPDWDVTFKGAVIDCIMAQGPGMVFSQWMTPETPTYWRRPGLCITGDAAHSALPFLGGGTSMAMEDAAVLSTVLGACKTLDDVTLAFQAFEHAQREKNEDLVKRSQLCAKFMTGQLGLDPELLAAYNPSSWWMDTIEYDVEGDVQRAIKEFHRLRACSSV